MGRLQDMIIRGGENSYPRARIARYKVPQDWFALPVFPTTASGKLQKYRLAEMARAGELERARF